MRSARASHSRLTVVSRESYSSVKALRDAVEITPQLGGSVGAARRGHGSVTGRSPRPAAAPRPSRPHGPAGAAPPGSTSHLPGPARPLRGAGRPGPGDAAPMGAGLLALSLLPLLLPPSPAERTGGWPGTSIPARLGARAGTPRRALLPQPRARLGCSVPSALDRCAFGTRGFGWRRKASYFCNVASSFPFHWN